MNNAANQFFLADDDPPSKREVLGCALHLFVRDGLCETSIRDIARASGYTNPALYKFFASKEALASHLFERCYLRLFSTIHGSQKRDVGFAKNLQALLEAYGRLADENLEAILYVNDTLRLFWPKLPRAARRRSLVSELRELIEHGVAAGELHPRVDIDLAVGMMLGTMAQVARMAYFGEVSKPIAEHSAGLLTLFRHALLRSKP